MGRTILDSCGVLRYALLCVEWQDLFPGRFRMALLASGYLAHDYITYLHPLGGKPEVCLTVESQPGRAEPLAGRLSAACLALFWPHFIFHGAAEMRKTSVINALLMEVNVALETMQVSSFLASE